MSVRYIGAIAIFICCGAFGFLKAAECRTEEHLMADLVRILNNMQGELTYRLTPLPQICADAAADASVCLQKVFSALTRELEAQIAPDAAACMQAALIPAKDLPASVRNALALLGNSLGRFDLQGQMNELSAVRQHCESCLEKLRNNQDLRLRSYQTLGLCVGAGLAILFL